MFEIGDKVIYHGADKAAYKREGTIVSIEDKDGKPQLVVELDGGGEFTAPIDDWSRKFNNAKACNAGKAMVARRGRYWYYAWADGSQNGEEGPFQTEEQATIAAKQDGFKIANAAINAKIKVGDEVRVWQYPIRGQYGKVVKVGLMEYDVEVDGKVYPGIDYRRVVKMPAANACTSTNSVVRNAMAAQGVVANADRYEEKSFGNGDVKASLKDFGRDPIYEIAVYATGITSAVSFADKGKKCVAEARAVLSAIERKASALKQAIAWMEQNAKNW